jgi:hypothetical protein
MRAAEACLTGGGMGLPHVDMTGALALAQADGVPASVAAPLLSAASAGIRRGLDDRRKDEA